MPIPTIQQLNNCSLDVSHIAEISNSAAKTAIDRMGNVKLTMRGAIDTIKAFNPKGVRVTGAVYNLKDVYTENGIAYATVVESFTSVSLSDDLNSGNVKVYQGITSIDLGEDSASYLINWKSQFVNSESQTIGWRLGREYNIDDCFVAGFDFLNNDVSSKINSYLQEIKEFGGGIVNFGPHAYFLKDVVIPHGVFLSGHSFSTTIVNTSFDKPSFSLEAYCGLNGVRAYYPNQTTTGDPIPHMPFITHASSGQVGAVAYATLSKIDLNNSYSGITLGSAAIGCGPLWIKDIVGWPMHTGIVLDNCTDVPYMENIHLNPNANQVSEYTQQKIYQSAVAFDIARVDGLSSNGIFGFGYSVGLRLRAGNPSGSASMTKIVNFGFDLCRSPLDIQGHGEGVFLTNGFCTTGGIYKGIVGGVCSLGNGDISVNGTITLNSVSFRNFYQEIVKINSNIEFVGCIFDDYNIAGGSNSAMVVVGPNVVLSLQGGSSDGRGRTTTGGVMSNGFTGNDIKVIGHNFKNMSARDISLFGTGSLVSYGNGDSAGSIWNGVPFAHKNGAMATYQNPATFPGVDPAAFPVGTKWENELPSIGQPQGWVRLVTNTIHPLPNL